MRLGFHSLLRTAALAAALGLWSNAGAAPATTPPPALAEAARSAGIAPGNIALWSAPVAPSSTPRLAVNAQQAMNTASVMKLLTSFAALDVLGSAHTWETHAWLGAPIRTGRLDGNLYIAGSGDPDLTWDRLGQWLRDWRARGLQHIRGDIIIDNSLFAPAQTSQVPFDDSPLRAYNVLPEPFQINFGALSVRLSPGTAGSPVTVAQQTPATPVRIASRLRSSAGACLDWRSGLRYDLRGEGADGFVLTLEGSLPTQCGERELNLAPEDSLRWSAAVIRAQWAELGGQWHGHLRTGSAPQGSPFSSWQSPPLAEIVRDMNKWSNNVMARQLFLSLGRTPENTAPLNPAQSAQRVYAWMNSQGLDASQWQLENGSGLSRNERTTAAQLGQLLRAAWQSPRMPEYLAALPVIGTDGTLRSRLKDGPLTGRGYIKTGSLDGVKSAAGYLLDRDGQWQVVVILINDDNAGRGSELVDSLLRWAYSGGEAR